MISSTRTFTEHLAAHAGITVERAEQAAHSVIAGLGAYLRGSTQQLVAEELPPALAAALVAGGDLARPIDERVIVPGLTAGAARELVASTCRVLAEELSSEALGALRLDLPRPVAELLVAASPEAAHLPPVHTRHETLAAGHTGSHRPISEGRTDRAHPGSVAATNPHAATKLSSGKPRS